MYRLHCQLKLGWFSNPHFTVNFKAKVKARATVDIKFPVFQVALDNAAADQGFRIEFIEITHISGLIGPILDKISHYFDHNIDKHLHHEVDPRIQAEIEKKLNELSTSVQKALIGN